MIVWTPAVLSVSYVCVLYVCICTCSAQLSIFHMERRSRNTLIIIIIIIIITIVVIIIITIIIRWLQFLVLVKVVWLCSPTGSVMHISTVDRSVDI